MTLETASKISNQEILLSSDYKGEIVGFEGVEIQWEKGTWEFNHPELGKIIKPTFPILNPSYWKEIAELLNQGKTAAGMMMGPYGVFKKLDAPHERKEQKSVGSADSLFERVKQRPKDQNFVALVHPKDIMEFVDPNRLREPYKTQLQQSEGRLKFYAGPQHVVLPVMDGKVNPALVRQADKTISCFWVPGHFGFEGLVGEARRTIKQGMLGGGSLNIHGREPHYDKDSLYQEIAQRQEWLEEIDFIIFDDIAEAGNIGRSHTMTRYTDEHPEVIRVGSLSLEKIRRTTGHDIRLDQGKLKEGKIKYASSIFPYSEAHNALVDQKIEEVLQRTQRFENWVKENS